MNNIVFGLPFVGLSVVSFFVAAGVAGSVLDPSSALIAMPLTACGLFCVLTNSFAD